jgi:hypothetical protein
MCKDGTTGFGDGSLSDGGGGCGGCGGGDEAIAGFDGTGPARMSAAEPIDLNPGRLIPCAVGAPKLEASPKALGPPRPPPICEATPSPCASGLDGDDGSSVDAATGENSKMFDDADGLVGRPVA